MLQRVPEDSLEAYQAASEQLPFIDSLIHWFIHYVKYQAASEQLQQARGPLAQPSTVKPSSAQPCRRRRRLAAASSPPPPSPPPPPPPLWPLRPAAAGACRGRRRRVPGGQRLLCSNHIQERREHRHAEPRRRLPERERGAAGPRQDPRDRAGRRVSVRWSRHMASAPVAHWSLLMFVPAPMCSRNKRTANPDKKETPKSSLVGS